MPVVKRSFTATFDFGGVLIVFATNELHKDLKIFGSVLTVKNLETDEPKQQFIKKHPQIQGYFHKSIRWRVSF